MSERSLTMKLTKRQIELIQTAAKLIATHGMEGLTIKSLSKKVGISQAAVYRHFSSKDQVLKCMILYLMGRLQNNMNNQSVYSENTIQILGKVIKNQFEFFSGNHEFVAVIFNEDAFMNNSALSSTVRGLMAMKKKFLTEYIKKGQADNSIRDDMQPEELTHILMGGIRLLILQWKLNDYSFDLAEKGEEYWNYSKKTLKKFPT